MLHCIVAAVSETQKLLKRAKKGDLSLLELPAKELMKYRYGSKKNSLLHYLVASCKPKLISDLFEIDERAWGIKNADGDTALHYLCERDDLTDLIIRVLAKFNKKYALMLDSEGNTIYHILALTYDLSSFPKIMEIKNKEGLAVKDVEEQDEDEEDEEEDKFTFNPKPIVLRQRYVTDSFEFLSPKLIKSLFEDSEELEVVSVGTPVQGILRCAFKAVDANKKVKLYFHQEGGMYVVTLQDSKGEYSRECEEKKQIELVTTELVIDYLNGEV